MICNKCSDFALKKRMTNKLQINKETCTAKFPKPTRTGDKQLRGKLTKVSIKIND